MERSPTRLQVISIPTLVPVALFTIHFALSAFLSSELIASPSSAPSSSSSSSQVGSIDPPLGVTPAAALVAPHLPLPHRRRHHLCSAVAPQHYNIPNRRDHCCWYLEWAVKTLKPVFFFPTYREIQTSRSSLIYLRDLHGLSSTTTLVSFRNCNPTTKPLTVAFGASLAGHSSPRASPVFVRNKQKAFSRKCHIFHSISASIEPWSFPLSSTGRIIVGPFLGAFHPTKEFSIKHSPDLGWKPPPFCSKANRRASRCADSSDSDLAAVQGYRTGKGSKKDQKGWP